MRTIATYLSLDCADGTLTLGASELLDALRANEHYDEIPTRYVSDGHVWAWRDLVRRTDDSRVREIARTLPMDRVRGELRTQYLVEALDWIVRAGRADHDAAERKPEVLP